MAATPGGSASGSGRQSSGGSGRFSGSAGLAGAAGGFAAGRDLVNQLQKEARDLAFLEREGLISQTDAIAERENIRRKALAQAEALRASFAAFPAVLDLIDRAVASVEFGNFGREMATAREEVDRTVATLGELETQSGAFAEKLLQTLPPIESAKEANRALTASYHELSIAVYNARVQLAALAGEEAAR